MDRIRDIYRALSRTEVRNLKKYLSAFHSKGENKALTLIKHLEKHPTIEHADMAEHLYGDAKSKAFIMLKSRLLDKMLESMNMSATLPSHPQVKEDPLAFTESQLHKQMSHALLLQQRGLLGLAEELLEKIAKEAEQAALPHLALMAQGKIRQVSRRTEEELASIHEALHDAQQQFSSNLQAREWMDLYRIKYEHHLIPDQDMMDFLHTAVQQMEERLEKAYSLHAHLDYLSLQLVQYKGMADGPRMRQTLNELKELVGTHPALQQKAILGLPSQFISEVAFGMKRFDEAKTAAREACKIFFPRHPSYLSASLHLMYACYLSGHLSECREGFTAIQPLLSTTNAQLRTDIAYYLHSCLLYAEGRVQQASQELAHIRELFRHKGGWSSALRIHEILLLLDMDHVDTAISRIEAFRKHLAKYPADHRTDCIFRYLILLERHSFDFFTRSEEMQDLLEELSQTDNWKPEGELIRFDIWIQSKIIRRSYYPLLLDILESESEAVSHS